MAVYKKYSWTIENEGIYHAWFNMKTRCDGKSRHSADTNNYFLRGITYGQRWSSFNNFKEDMGKTYEKGLTLERINNNEGYSLKNCRWATRKEQNNNKRNNRNITLNGETKTLSQWIELSDQKPSTVRQRFYVYGWPIEKALGFNRKNG